MRKKGVSLKEVEKEEKKRRNQAKGKSLCEAEKRMKRRNEGLIESSVRRRSKPDDTCKDRGVRKGEESARRKTMGVKVDGVPRGKSGELRGRNRYRVPCFLHHECASWRKKSEMKRRRDHREAERIGEVLGMEDVSLTGAVAFKEGTRVTRVMQRVNDEGVIDWERHGSNRCESRE